MCFHGDLINGPLRPLTLLLKYEVRGKFNANACLSLAIGRKNMASWRVENRRADIELYEAETIPIA